jgi:hypothetical protein
MSPYIVIQPGEKPFTTKWYQFENHWTPNIGMMVIYLPHQVYTVDGVNWYKLESDEL